MAEIGHFLLELEWWESNARYLPVCWLTEDLEVEGSVGLSADECALEQ